MKTPEREVVRVRAEAEVRARRFWRRVRKVLVAIAGGVCLLLALLTAGPLPGPATLFLLIGFGLLASEFRYFRKWYRLVRLKSGRSWRRWRRRREAGGPNG